MKRPKGSVWYGDFDSDAETGRLEVIEAEDAFEPRPTGVLDKNGRMICHQPERIGFVMRRLAKR